MFTQKLSYKQGNLNSGFIESYLRQIEQWYHFQVNDFDKKARKEEKGFLKEFVIQIENQKLKNKIIEILTEISNKDFSDKKQLVSLLNECVDVLTKNQNIFSYFEERDLMESLLPDNEEKNIKKIILSENTWKNEEKRKRLFRIFNKTKNNEVIHENCYYFLRLIAKSIKLKNDFTVCKDDELIKNLWKSIINVEFQYRVLAL